MNLIRDRTFVLHSSIMFSKSSRLDETHKLARVYLKRLPIHSIVTTGLTPACSVWRSSSCCTSLASGVQCKREKPSNLIYNEKMCSKVEQLHVTVPFCVVAQNLKKTVTVFIFLSSDIIYFFVLKIFMCIIPAGRK